MELPLSTIHAAGYLALLFGLISTFGVVMLVAMYYFFATHNQALGYKFGNLNDISAALQYLLLIPIALVLYSILQPHHPSMIRIATIVGILSMLATALLQLLLILKFFTFEQQLPWITLSILFGVGFWFVVSGLVARDTGRLPHSLLVSSLAVPYFGVPVWAFWLGLRLIRW
jgi:hypothetical protein